MEELIKMHKKICLLGDPAVGKTSLIKRFVFNEFDEKYITTIGTNVSKKNVTVVLQEDNKNIQKVECTLAIWDIIGQRDMHSFNLNYFRNANGGLVICDITRKDTLENLDLWTTSFFNTVGEVPVVFIVNKFDLRNQAAFKVDEISSIAEKFNAPYYITSAKTSENIEAVFYTLSEQMVKRKVKRLSEKENEVSKVASEIIIEFSNIVGGIERGIPLIKEIFKAAGVDFLNPQKEQLVKALPDLVQLVRDLKNSEIAEQASNNFDKIIGKLN